MARRKRPPPVDYLSRTRELPVNVLFLMPWLVVYELSLLATNSPVENAAGAWFRTLAGTLGREGLAAVGILVSALLLALVTLRAHQAPRDRGVYGGMLLEGLAYGGSLGLVAGVLAAHLPLGRMVPLSGFSTAGLGPTVERLGLAAGAGVFEEILFRGLVLAGSFALLRHVFGADRWTAGLVAIVGSAWLFSAWHHWGPGAEPWSEPVFRFRFAAGAVLGTIFLTRGLGIAAFAHGFYDAIVMLSR